MSRRALLPMVLALSCVGSTDDRSQVHDLRVLGVNFEPPELMAPPCASKPTDPACLFTAFLAYSAPVKMTWLIEDPKGEGRALGYEVLACANQNDLKCADEGDFQQLASGTTDAGELSITLRPGITSLPDPDGGHPLLEEVQAQDGFKGAGGILMPIVIHLLGQGRADAGAEELFAQKLMVFSYPFFPTMKPNVNPHLPGMRFDDGGVWGETFLPQFSGHPDAGVKLEPLGFADLQETYVVPTFELQPLTLTEAWKISWHADLGHFSPTETGGVGLDGNEGRHRAEWKPFSTDRTEKDVTFWFVVRDGRGGQTWISRRAHWTP